MTIGGVGGSGTRVYHRFCSQAGYHMGIWNTHASLDCVPLARWFYPRWADRYLGGTLTRRSLAQMRWECRFWLRVANPIRAGSWGWKEPRGIYLLDFFHALFPGLRFIHVIRDGRDLAFNPRFAYRAHEASVLREEERGLPPEPRKGLHWARLNRRGETYAHAHMKGTYLLSRLEDLCADPAQEIARVFAFLGCTDPEAILRAALEVHVPASLGRWRSQETDQIKAVEALIAADLDHYGYQPHNTS